MFWLWTALLCALAIAFVLPPLLREAPRPPRDEALDAAILRDQLSELERDLQEGVLGQKDYAQARADLERTLLENSAPPESVDVPRDRRRSLGVALLLAALIPSTSWLIYDRIGVGASGIDFLTRPHDPHLDALGPGSAMPDIEAMLARVRQRVTDDPTDYASWNLLARSLYNLDRIDEALEAWRSAIDHGLEDADTLVRYADLLADRQGRLTRQSEAYPFIERALNLDPEHTTGLWLAGTAAFNEGDTASARAYWQRLQALLPADSEMARIIRANLHALEQ